MIIIKPGLLIKGIFAYSKIRMGYFFPLVSKIRITHNCNNQCKHCFRYLHRESIRELPEAEWCRAIDRLAALGCLSVAFVGGEPTLRKDLFNIAKHVR